MQRQDLPVTPRGDLTDELWNRIYPYLPVSRRGDPFDNLRDTVNGILRILQTGSPWRDLLPVYETGIPYTNVLPDKNRQAYLNPYSKLFPKMPTCRM